VRIGDQILTQRVAQERHTSDRADVRQREYRVQRRVLVVAACVDLARGREVAGQVALGVEQGDVAGGDAVGTDVAAGQEAAATALLLCNVTQDVCITGSQ
jgi:hypothetical protein